MRHSLCVGINLTPSGCDRVNISEYLGKTAVSPVLTLRTPLQRYVQNYGSQDFSPLTMWFTIYILIIMKTPLRNGNSPVTDPITEIEVNNITFFWGASDM